jgi:hypothetical protein
VLQRVSMRCASRLLSPAFLGSDDLQLIAVLVGLKIGYIQGSGVIVDALYAGACRSER